MTDSENLTDHRGALQAVIAAAALRDPHLRTDDGRDLLILPADFRPHDVSDPYRLPPRPKADVTVDDRASLEHYVKRHLGSDTSILLADYDKGTITAILDWHPHNQAIGGTFGQAGARQHRCTLTLRPSEEWKRWDEFEGTQYLQTDFARFIEENASDICDPDPATMIELSRDLEAVQSTAFKARTRLENGDMSFAFESDTKIVSRVQAPNAFALSIPLYQGEAPEVLQARFRWKAHNGVLTLGFEWHRVEYMRQARFAQIAHDAAEATGLPAYLGRQSA